MTGLAELANRNYHEVAQNFLQMDLDSWDSNNVLTPNNVTIYGGICALASFNREELQSVISNMYVID